MKKIITLVFFLFPIVLLSQIWHSPIIISREGDDMYPDFCIDNQGNLHCVWAHFETSDSTVINYSKSVNGGISWSAPKIISQNSSAADGPPRIICNEQNHLFITFINYKDPYYLLLYTNKGSGWSDADTISTPNMKYSNNNRMFVDNNNKVYLFWATNMQTSVYYRTYENDQLSDTICLFKKIKNKGYSLSEFVVDNKNNIHAVGGYYSNGQPFSWRHVYFKHDYISDAWSDFTYLNKSYFSRGGSAIALDKYQQPHCVWRSQLYNTWSTTIGTLYSHQNDSDWLLEDTVSINKSYQPTISIDGNNKPHIIFYEHLSKGVASLVHYYRQNNKWKNQIIDVPTKYATDDYRFQEEAPPKLISYNNYLYLVYRKKVGNTIKIALTKARVAPLGIENYSDNTGSPVLSQNYPNPCSKSTKINFELKTSGQTSLTIYDIQGKVVSTLINGYKEAGNYSVDWDLTVRNGQKASQGIYFYCLQSDKYIQTKSIIIE